MSQIMLASMLAKLATVLQSHWYGEVPIRTEMARPHLIKLIDEVDRRGLGELDWSLDVVDEPRQPLTIRLVIRGRDADGVIRWHGVDLASIRGVFDLKSAGDEEAWRRVIVSYSDAYAVAKLARMDDRGVYRAPAGVGGEG